MDKTKMPFIRKESLSEDQEKSENLKEVKEFSFKELCIKYDVSAVTFKKWLIPIKDKLINQNKRYRNFCPRDVQLIYEHLGEPI